jgi:nucleolar MIF4G domain-containing protein 1
MLYADALSGGNKSRGGLGRKERRKAERVQKKAQRSQPPPLKRTKLNHVQDPETSDEESDFEETAPLPNRTPLKVEEPKDKPKSILKKTKQDDKNISTSSKVRSPSPPPRISRAVRDKLAEDDDEIAALEKKLGLKGKKKLPQAFADDGLDELLAGLDGDSEDDLGDKKRKRSEEDDWLAAKRRKAQGLPAQEEEEDDDEDDEASDEDMFDDDGDEDLSDAFGEDEDAESEEENIEGDEEFGGFDSDTEVQSPSQPRVRENPYVAPVSNVDATPAKYIPPSLRKPATSDSEVLLRLRRQTQGLVNRLTEANLITILGEIERLYRDNARQHVTSTLVDLLLTSVCEPTTLPDTLIILPAGFIAAVYKVIGTDFGAQVVQRTVELFDEHYKRAVATSNDGPAASTTDTSKETSNMIALLSELYNFQVIGSNLMFDYIRLFLGKLSELNAELLLKIIRVSGPQLRQDDPSALKDIVSMLRPAVEKVGEANISVRTKFMIETINDLKNNKMKTGATASAIMSEHTVRMKKTLGSLNSRSLKATEPLRIGLKDIQESDKKGKWWLVGASWAGKDDGSEDREQDVSKPDTKNTKRNAVVDSGTSDLLQLAREQRMNTDIRRAIFITVMSASDYQDAYLKLMKLKLKKAQELEIPKVLVHCSGADRFYNPYYTLIAKRLCGDKKLRMAFQFSLWDLFKRMGESDDEGNEYEDEDNGEAMDMRQIVNLAKMYANLIVDGALGLNVLKNLSLSYLQPKTKTFVEVLLITIMLQTQAKFKDKRDEAAVISIIMKAKDTPGLVRGLQYFLKKVVSKTDIAGGKAEKATVKWACKVAGDALAAVFTSDAAVQE